MAELITTRRAFITGLVSFIAAPAIVRVSSIMPVKAIEPFILPPEMYDGAIQIIAYNKMDARFVWKIWRHAENYGMSIEKIQQVLSRRV